MRPALPTVVLLCAGLAASDALAQAATARPTRGAAAPRPTAAAPSPARPASPGLVLLPLGDTVLVYLDSSPPRGFGWRVRRDGTPVTTAPVTALDDATLLPSSLGDDWPLVQRATEADDALQALRRLRSNSPAATVVVARSRAAGIAAGRVVVDAAAPRGRTVEYVAELVALRTDAPPRRRLRGTVLAAPGVLPAVTGLRVVTEGGMPGLRWSVADSPALAWVVGFLVERAEGDGPFALVTPEPLLRLQGADQRWRDGSAPAGIPLRYRVRVLDLAERAGPEGATVATTFIDRRGPLPPTESATESRDAAIRVAWRLSLDPAVTGYVVERASGIDTVFRRLTPQPLPATAAEWTDSTVRGITPYAYRIRAVGASGVVGAPGTAVVGTAFDRAPPVPATALVATLGAGRRAALAWTPSTSRDLLGYWIFRGAIGERMARLGSRPVTGRTSRDSALSIGLQPGRTYVYHVVALDSALNEAAPAVDTLVVPDDVAPDPARTVRAENDRGRQVVVRWTASPATDVARYDVTRTPAAGGATVVVGRVGASDALEFVDTTAARGVRQRWAVVPVDSAGNRGAAASDTLTFRELDPPAPSRRLMAVRRGAAVVLTWEPSPSRDVAGYHVYRSARPGAARTRLTTAPVAALTLTDAGAPRDAFYVVRAVDRAGNESVDGPMAQEAQVPRGAP
jgi:fibronectin type 3 domain-containing protein